jgi:starch synthase
MEILFVSPEIVPFSKVGGLADVTSALPKALRALGHRVTVLSLLYGTIDPTANALARRLVKVQVPLAGRTLAAEVYEARLPSGVNVVLLNAPGLTDRPRIYGEPDDAQRFAFLCRGAVEWMRAQSKLPDLVHAQDWTAALVPLFLRLAAESDPRLASVKTVFSIHNLAFQGVFDRATLAETGIPESYFTPQGLEFYGQVNWMKAGIQFANKVTTVSPAYAKEITTPAGGAGLDGVLRARGRDLVGILNGVDFAVWNPATDPHIAARFDAEALAAKDRCKAELLAQTGLTPRPETPLLGFVGRLDAQKGLDLLLAAAPRLMRQDLQLVLLGEGDPALAEGLTELAKRFPERVFFKQGFDDVLAHKIYAGADFFLAPSRTEPCGLTHLYAMRYGAIPIARATGGLKDTVLDADRHLETGSGFLFEHADAEEFYGAVSRALAAWQQPDGLAKLRRRVMRKDLSWDRSARQYQALYTHLTESSAATASR